MELPNYVDNKIKYQRALANAKDPNNVVEVRALYVSYGGNLINEAPIVAEEVKEVPAIVEEVVNDVVAEEVPVVEEVVEVKSKKGKKK